MADALWPDLAPAAAANNLRQAVHAARRALRPPAAGGATYLAALDGDRLALRPAAAVWVDVAAFEAAAAAARRRGEPAAYRAALALDGGELLPEDRYEDWAAARREALRRPGARRCGWSWRRCTSGAASWRRRRSSWRRCWRASRPASRRIGR